MSIFQNQEEIAQNRKKLSDAGKARHDTSVGARQNMSDGHDDAKVRHDARAREQRGRHFVVDPEMERLIELETSDPELYKAVMTPLRRVSLGSYLSSREAAGYGKTNVRTNDGDDSPERSTSMLHDLVAYLAGVDAADPGQKAE